MTRCSQETARDETLGCSHMQVFTTLQSVHVKRGEQGQQALDLFVAEQGVELLRDVSTCNASVSACEKREEWQQALGLPGSPDVLPKSVTYSAAISACDKGEQRQQALDLFVVEQSVELLRDVITCNTSIACEKREQWRQALGLLGSPDVLPNSVTNSAAISACDKGEPRQ